MALRQKRLDAADRAEQGREDNVIYVIPPWAQPARRRRWGSVMKERITESPLWEMLGFEVKVVVLAGVLLGLGYVGLKGLYRIKSEAGVDLIKGVHAPDIIPFLR